MPDSQSLAYLMRESSLQQNLLPRENGSGCNLKCALGRKQATSVGSAHAVLVQEHCPVPALHLAGARVILGRGQVGGKVFPGGGWASQEVC